MNFFKKAKMAYGLAQGMGKQNYIKNKKKIYERYIKVTDGILMIAILVFLIMGMWSYFALAIALFHINYRMNEMYWDIRSMEHTYIDLVREVNGEEDE